MDFQSNLQRCRIPVPIERADPAEWGGLSVFDTREGAEATTRYYGFRIGHFVAEVRLPADATVFPSGFHPGGFGSAWSCAVRMDVSATLSSRPRPADAAITRCGAARGCSWSWPWTFARPPARVADEENTRTVRYELMDLETGNLVRAYASETAALRDVAATVRRLGPEAVADLALGDSDHPPGATALTGQELIERALAIGALKNSRVQTRRRPTVSA